MINVNQQATDFFSVKRKTNYLRLISLLGLFFFLIILPFILPNRFYIRLVNEMLIYALLAMSLDVLFGYTGMLSFMHNAYLGISAYLVGLFLKHITSSSLGLALIIGLVGTSFIALPVGWVQVRTGGLAFALLTLAFGMMFFTVAWKWYGLTGGSDCLMGIPLPDIRLGEWSIGSLNDFTLMYLVTLFVVAICVGLTWRVIHSPFGAVLEAIRENPVRASFIGINLRKCKLIGWMLACGLASVSGTLFVLFKGYMGPETMSAFAGGAVLMMVLLGGHGTLWGPILGAGIFIFIQDSISTMTDHWEIFIGLVVVLLVLFMPRGAAGIWESLLWLKRGNQN